MVRVVTMGFRARSSQFLLGWSVPRLSEDRCFFGENMETNVDNIWTILNNSMKLREHLVLDIGFQIRGWQTEFVDLWGIEVQKLSGETTHISALSTDTTADLILGWWILCQQSTSGWWFGTFCIFPYIYIIIIYIIIFLYIGNNNLNWLSYFSEG